jgi:hypothetical protein
MASTEKLHALLAERDRFAAHLLPVPQRVSEGIRNGWQVW